MREQGYVLQCIPLGRDNIVTVAKPKLDNYQRQPMAVLSEVPQFVQNFRKLEDLLKHCKTALLALETGAIKSFPEAEFVLAYGKPSLWSNWHELAKFAKYKIQSEGFLNYKTACWSRYALKLRDWALNQGQLALEDPQLHEMVPGKPTPRPYTDPDLPFVFTAGLDARFHPYPGRANEIDPNRKSIDSGNS